MILQCFLLAHIAVLGYWLGSEFVINSTYRYVSYSASMPFAERDRLMQHVMKADQHVRYALVLQLGLGFSLAALLGYLPGGQSVVFTACLLMVLWLALVELSHRLGNTSNGRWITALDRYLRYSIVFGLLAFSIAALAGLVQLPFWLALKLLCFASVMLCGVAIRLALIGFFKLWKEIELEGSNSARELQVKGIYRQATGILVLLWVFIIVIVVLSLIKPLLQLSA